jgi:hypothetical protein
MPPFFQSIKSFKDVPITEDGVDTKEYLEASEGLVGIFDLLGSTAFSTVQSDLKGNIAKVRARYEKEPSKSATLEQLVLNEPADDKKKTATQGLLWLLRGQSFTCKGLQNAQTNKTEELSAAFTKGYENSLKPHHNFVIKGVFAVAMKACPYRAGFYEKLAADPNGGPPSSQDKVDADLNEWLGGLDTIVKRMESFYEGGGHAKGL